MLDPAPSCSAAGTRSGPRRRSTTRRFWWRSTGHWWPRAISSCPPPRTASPPPRSSPPVGTIMTISKDRVKPSPTPDSWKLKEIFATSVLLGSYLALMTVIFFWAMHDTTFFLDRLGVRDIRNSSDEMMSAFYLQVSIISQALIFVTYSGSWSFVERPRLLLMSAFAIAQLGLGVEIPMASPTIEHRSLYQSEELYKYILETSVYPREHEQLKEIRKATATHPWSMMCMSPDEGQFLTLLLKSMNARKTIEVGVFTGYSLLATALALPEDGKAVGIDVDRRTYEEIGLPCITKAGVADKVEFIEAPAIEALDEMLRTGTKDEFDFAFVDAVKQEYEDYHERLLKLVRVGGLLAYDNTLWFGSLGGEYSPSEKKSASFYEIRSFFLRFNHFLAADPRIEISQLCLGDGITLCRRIV